MDICICMCIDDDEYFNYEYDYYFNDDDDDDDDHDVAYKGSFSKQLKGIDVRTAESCDSRDGMRMLETISTSSSSSSSSSNTTHASSSSSSSAMDTCNELIIDLLMTWLTKIMKEGQ